MSARKRKKNETTASNRPAPTARPVISRRRKWVFRLTVMVLAPVLFVAVLEAGLRLGGYGYATSFFLGPDADGTYTANPQFGSRFFPRALVRKPVPCFVSGKPAGTVRVFVLGSSAAQGIPNPSFSLGRILEVMLRERYPGVKFEVINAAMTAINSHVALEIARDCAAHEPDLFVVYMGNNEVVGPYGPGTVFEQWSPSLRLIRANMWAKSTRVGQLLGNAVGRIHAKEGAPASWQGMEMFLGNQVAADDPRLEAVYGNFRQNLRDVCEVGRRGGAAVILSTLAVNVSDCPPFASQHRADLSAEELAKWESAYQAGVKLESENGWEEALKEYEAAARVDDRFAELEYRIGRCLAELGRSAEARERFVLARDLDVLRFRADARINGVIREVTAESEASGVWGVDAERALANGDLAGDGISDKDLFCEHVHLTFDGNYLLARAVMEQVESALPQLAASRKGEAVVSKQQCLELLPLTAWDEYQMAGQIAAMTARPPFTNQYDHSVRQASAQARVERLGKRALAAPSLAAAVKRYEAAIEKTSDDWDLRQRYGMLAMISGDPATAAEQFELVVKRLPSDAAAHVSLGQALQNCGQIDKAISHFRKALELDPRDSMAHNDLGNALSNRGRIDEAFGHYETALEIDPQNAFAHNNLGVVLAKRGKLDEAMEHFQKALEIAPSNRDARNNLESVRKMGSGKAGKAKP